MMFLFFNNSISAGAADPVSAVCRPRPRQAGGQRRQNQPQGGIRIQSQQDRPHHRRRGGAARPQRRAEQNRHQTGLADAPFLQRQNPQTLHRPCRRPVPHERQVQEEAAAQTVHLLQSGGGGRPAGQPDTRAEVSGERNRLRLRRHPAFGMEPQLLLRPGRHRLAGRRLERARLPAPHPRRQRPGLYRRTGKAVRAARSGRGGRRTGAV